VAIEQRSNGGARRVPGASRPRSGYRCPVVSVEKRQDLLTLADLLTTGQVTPVIDRTYPLDEAADALSYVAAGHTRGKVVITL